NRTISKRMHHSPEVRRPGAAGLFGGVFVGWSAGLRPAFMPQHQAPTSRATSPGNAGQEARAPTCNVWRHGRAGGPRSNLQALALLPAGGAEGPGFGGVA